MKVQVVLSEDSVFDFYLMNGYFVKSIVIP